MERAFRDMLGIRHVVWLTGAPPEVCEALSDVTDYHVDIAARFTPAGTVLYCDPSDRGDPRCAILAQHRADLQAAVDIRGRAFDLVPLPTPGIYSVAVSYTHLSQRAWVFQKHPEWLLHNAAGQLIHIGYVTDKQDPLYVLDTTNPGAQDYLKQTYSTLYLSLIHI